MSGQIGKTQWFSSKASVACYKARFDNLGLFDTGLGDTENSAVPDVIATVFIEDLGAVLEGFPVLRESFGGISTNFDDPAEAT